MAIEFPVVGASVKVVRGISKVERGLMVDCERVYILDRYTKPHGYAVIVDGPDSWHVHPEALEDCGYRVQVGSSCPNCGLGE